MSRKQFLSVVAMCLPISSALYAQVTIPSNFAPLGTQYVGWSGAAGSISKPLDVKNFFVNQNIDFYTNGTGANGAATKRMTIIGSSGLTAGFVGIGNSFTAPLQRLHVVGDINLETSILTRTATNDGYRINNITVLQVKQADNLFIGWHAGENWLAAGIAQNTFVGNYAGYLNTIGSHNTFLGFSAGRANNRASNNTFIGYQAGLANGGNSMAERNTFIGNGSGYQNTSGQANTFIGDLSGAGNISGNFNTYLGAYTAENLPGSIQANYNTFAGHDAGHDITTGDGNAVLGAQAAEHITTGEGNFIGGLSAANNINIGSGKNNVYIGLESGLSNANVDNNVFMGYQTGRNHTGSTFCTFIGYRAGFNNTLNTYTYTNAAGIGANAVPTATNKMILGDNKVFVGIGLSNDLSASLGPQNCLEINAHLLGSAVPTPDKSGLRFRQLTSASPAGPAVSKVLTVDANGDVILVAANAGSTTIGNICGDAVQNPLTNNWEIPLAGFNYVFTGQGTSNYNVGIGTACTPAAKLDVVQSSGNSTTIAVQSNNYDAYGTGGIFNGDQFGVVGSVVNVASPSKIGVSGIVSNAADFSCGVRGGATSTSGTVIGVSADATGSGANENYAFLGSAQSSAQYNYGIKTNVQGGVLRNYGAQFLSNGPTSGVNYGVYAQTGLGSSNIALFAQAGGSGPNDYAGYFLGDVYDIGTMYAGSYLIASDQNIKTNIDTIPNALHILNQLHPKTFYYDTLNSHNLKLSDKRQYGLIAQDVETILPELVSDVTKPADYDSLGNVTYAPFTYKTLNYDAFTAILIKGIQEQQEQLSAKDSLITVLKQNDSLQDYRLTLLESAVNNCCNNGHSMQQNNNSSNAVSSINVDLKDKQVVILEQNNPNPFNEQTTISYFLPDNVSKAEMLFYNAQGRLIQSVELKEKGKGQLNVFANDLSNGIYTYTLVVDGKIMETKKMLRQ